MDKKPTRDGYGLGLVALGEADDRIVVLSGDLTESTRSHWFQKKFPERFFNMGVAEQDMISTAAGLSLAGKIPFCSTFSIFASGRAWDQVRVSLCYMNLNVNIGGSHGGISVGADGATHQALEDITLMRALPHMTVIVPADVNEAKQATIASAATKGPVFLRLSREAVPVISGENDPFVIGKAKILRPGKDITIIACGVMVCAAIEAAQLLEKSGIDAEVINLHTIKPIDAEAILRSAKKTKRVLTVEEHSVVGGMGSAVCELLSQEYPIKVKMMGMKDRFGESGKPSELFKAFGLTADDIAKNVTQMM